MITLNQAKSIKPGQIVAVSNTGQTWTVDKVVISGVMPFIHIWRMDESGIRQNSVIPPERMHLFDEVKQAPAEPVVKPKPVAPPEKPDLQENLTQALHETVEASTADLTKQEQTSERIEDKFLQEPKLKKPARPARSKKTKGK